MFKYFEYHLHLIGCPDNPGLPLPDKSDYNKRNPPEQVTSMA